MQSNPCDCKHLCKKYTRSGTEYADDVKTMQNCPHFKAQPPQNLGTVVFRMKNGAELVVRPDDVEMDKS